MVGDRAGLYLWAGSFSLGIVENSNGFERKNLVNREGIFPYSAIDLVLGLLAGNVYLKGE